MILVKKIFLNPQDNEYVLKDNIFSVVKGNTQALAAPIGKFGRYVVVTIKHGVLVMWDQKTSVFIKLNPQYYVNTDILDGFRQNIKAKVPQSCKKKYQQYFLFLVLGSGLWIVWKL